MFAPVRRGPGKGYTYEVQKSVNCCRHHGGGHASASGATVYSREEMEALIREADEAARAYKESHEGWL